VKNKFYTTLLLWLGLAFVSATGYAKSAHAKPIRAKHANVAAKGVKATAGHISARKKHAIETPVAGFVNHRKRTTLYSSHSARKSSPIFASEDILLAQEAQDNSYAPSENERIHSLVAPNNTIPVAPRNNNVLVDRSTNDRLETPRHITSTHGVVNTSLSSAGLTAGLTTELVLQLANVFAWDIDFATNLRQGDQFTVVYEETGGNNDSFESRIVAAEFVNQGRILTAIRYKDDAGNINYYSPEGRPMRKAFLSTPVDFIRISSGFDTQRKHPILNKIRAHKGVDYAARIGTPVKSAGDGEVVFCGNKGGYGQALIIKHGERYETLYAHLSDFKDGIKPGDQVTQGEVIAYVGQTGLATGPHLHYEFRVDGVHRNPETLSLAQPLPLHAEILADFKAQTYSVLTQLNQAKARTLLAKNQDTY